LKLNDGWLQIKVANSNGYNIIKSSYF